MEAKKEGNGLLDLLIRPGFCVKENMIVQTNSAADALLITPGTDVRTLLLTGTEEYEAFSEGCLYLKLNLTAKGCGASVTRIDEQDVFILDQESDDGELQALALAARELREPLSCMMIALDHLAPLLDDRNAPAAEQLTRMNRGLYQMLRIIGNMSDAGRSSAISQQEIRDIGSVFQEIFEKAQHLVEQTGVLLSYEGISREILCLADDTQLERAVLNILSNALKFTPKDGSIEARLTLHGRMLRLSITDSGSGIAEQVRTSIFHRYLRQSGIEDSRSGLGLGMVLIRSTAANHGGTVLIDQPEGKGTRITMTMAIRQNPEARLRSPILRVDYTGERDHVLVELSQQLPLHLYEIQ